MREDVIRLLVCKQLWLQSGTEDTGRMDLMAITTQVS